MQISKEWLKSKSACTDGYEWSLKTLNGKPMEAKKFIKILMKEEKWQWANWVIVRLFTKEQNVQYAIYAAEQVTGIYEKKYPTDKRPRKAIEAAKAWLKEPNDKTKAYAAAAADAAAAAADAAAAAAAAAAYAAYAAAAAYDAAAAAYAAYAAAAAYDAAAYDAAADAAAAAAAAYAAAAAADAAAAAAAAYDAAVAARKKMRIKVLDYGLKLLKEN